MSEPVRASSASDAPSTLAFTHLNLEVSDLDAAAAFYGEILGLPFERTATAVRVEHPDYLIVLERGEPLGGSTAFRFGFRVEHAEQVDAWIRHVRARGVAVLRDAAATGAVYVARIADPDGHPIEIYCEVARTP